MSVRLVKAAVVCAAYQVGLRGYCWSCDSLRWAWTHRHCGRRAHAAAAQFAADPAVRAAIQALRDEQGDQP